MTLHIHNTLTRRLEAFEPLEPGHVRMYVCGITVYDRCHLGHARMVLSFDAVYRWLRARGWRVTYVRNITDIDDKIIRRALERGLTIRALTDEMIALMHADFDALKLLRPTHEPRATEFVPQMLGLIGRLEENGLAYRVPNVEGGGEDGGDVNFAPVHKVGYYTLQWTGPLGPTDVEVNNKSRRALAANLLDQSESQVATRPTLALATQVVAATKPGEGPGTLNLWPYLLALCCGVLLVEWFIYNRKVSL